MNTRLKTVVTFALVVVLSAGLAMAGRGGGGGHGGGGRPAGGGGGGGGFHGGGGGGGGFHAGGGGYHAPSFSSPRQSFSARTSELQHRIASRSRQPRRFGRRQQNVRGHRQPLRRANRSGIGERPGIANTPNWDNRLNAGNRANIDNRVNIGNRAYVANRPINGNNINHSNNFAGQTQSNWNGRPFQRWQLVPRQLERQLEQRLE